MRRDGERSWPAVKQQGRMAFVRSRLLINDFEKLSADRVHRSPRDVIDP